MTDLSLSPRSEKQDTKETLGDKMHTLSHIRIDDNGHIIAIFNDNSEMDVTNLFSEAARENYVKQNKPEGR